MSTMRQKLLFQTPPDPDGLHEIADRVYVFISCFGAQQECGEERYKLHVETVVGQFRRTVPEASVLVCNFRDEETKTATFNAHAVMNYPRHHLGCPVLRMKDTWRFLSSCENWLSRGHRDVVLMHCERGAWPVLAFALAALLVFRKQCEGEKRALDMVYEQAPRQLLHSLMAVNQIPSQLRYLRYVATWNRALDLVPLNGVIRLDCIVLKFMPKFDGEGGCGSVLRVHGCDPFVEDGTPKCLYSTPEKRKNAWDCEQASEMIGRLGRGGDCETIKVNINCHIKGDVLIEIINLNGDTESEQILFRVMFNVAFVGSNILLLNRDKIDVLWYAKDHFPKNFRAEILFSEMDASTALLKNGTLCFEEEGLPVEAFSKWMNPMEDPALNNVPQQKRASPDNTIHEKLNTGSNQYVESGSLLHIKGPQMPQAKKNEANFFLSSNMENQFVTSAKQSPDNSMSRKEKTIKADATQPRPSKSDIISHEIPSPFERTSESSNCTNLSIELHPSDFTLSDSLDISSSCSISPQTPPQLPPLTRSAKEVHDSHSHHHLPSKSRPLTKEIEFQSQDRSHFSSTPGTPVSSTSHNKSPDDSASHSPSSAITSNQSPPLEKILPFRTKLDSSLSQPQTLPSPTPPLKEQKPIRARPPASPPTPPLKEQESIRARPPASPPTPRLKEQKPIRARALASPPTPPLKEQEPIRAKPLASSPTPPTPPLKEQEPSRAKPLASPPTPPLKELEPIRARPLASPPTPPTPPLKEQEPIRAKPLASPPTPPTPPLKEHEPIRAGPPPSPPTPPPKVERRIRSGAPPSPPSSPPRPFGKAASATPIPPPPPPAAALFSDHSNSSLQKSLAVPAAPPPPTSFGNGGIQPDNAFSKPLSMGGNGHNVSSTKGRSSIGSKGRILSHTNSMTHTKKLKPLHWLKLSRAVKGSLWAETQKSGEASKAPEINMSELENLFSAAVPSSGPSKKANVQSSVGPKSDKVQLIEHTRAYNCEIVLSKVKVPLHDLMGSVLALEESALDTDQVENLIKFCPTKEEIEILKGYTGEKEKLGRCEQFFLELMKVPRVESKLRVFSFKIQFHSRVSDLRNSLNVVNAAAEEIRNSVKLKRIMQTILSLGNALNQGTAKGSAIGFRLDSLLKLTDTRARNKKITLMHYLCKVLADKLPEVLDFSKDLANLEPAAKIQLKLLEEEMQTISKGLEKVEHERSTSENDGPISETFCKNLKEYLCSAKAEGSSLSSLYSVMGRNVDDLIIYFGEDPCRCPFEQVVTTLHHFTGMLNKAHEENCKQLELEMKKTEETVK